MSKKDHHESPAHKPAHAAHKPERAHPKTTDASAYDADLGLQAYTRLRTRIHATAPAKQIGLDLDKAAVAALAVGNRLKTGPLYPALQAMSRIDAGIAVFDIRNVDDLPDAALACRYLRKQADAAIAKSSKAKLPAALVTQSAEVEKRMQRVCEGTLEDVPEAQSELDRLRPGTDYLDRAGDLEGYADLYDEYPQRVKLDGVRYQAGDPALARQIAQQILANLGEPLSEGEQAQLDELRRGFAFMLGLYGECQRAGILLGHGDPASADLYPSLFAVGRAPAKRSSGGATESASEEPTVPAPGAPPADAIKKAPKT